MISKKNNKQGNRSSRVTLQRRVGFQKNFFTSFILEDD